ncbi:hypothetical protein CPLU01_06679 [Colletotrichum plurivorum]|uniref:Uncharacterized protein n=1 Tax=Colletotrichum plurivorum TaxID=2175906 RepID=A0A8H6NG16_9PEZI|nr:hypothetical protein CPLU01_06679 [Colletotrichum plurivorum]
MSSRQQQPGSKDADGFQVPTVGRRILEVELPALRTNPKAIRTPKFCLNSLSPLVHGDPVLDKKDAPRAGFETPGKCDQLRRLTSVAEQ